MSHIKNVEAFGKLLGICTGYGGKFIPGNPNLQAKVMSALMNNARQVMSEVHAAKTDYDNATNTRELAFKDIQRFGTRLISALKSNGVSTLTIEDARASVRKIYGSKKESQLPENANDAGEPTTKSRRARGLDFGTMAYQFAKLVKTISAEPNYHVNEPELSLEGLSQKADMLVSLNETVYQITAKLNNARSKRNELLYGTGNNLVDTGMAVKHYVRSTFGPKSNEYAEVKKIQFTKPGK